MWKFIVLSFPKIVTIFKITLIDLKHLKLFYLQPIKFICTDTTRSIAV